MPFDHFNFIAGVYNRSGQFNVTEKLSELLSLSPNTILLDVGGGTGRVAAALRCMVRDVFVADTSLGMLRYAVDKRFSTVCAQAESLPLPSACVDRVIMVDALHHVLDQKQTICELWRVLIPDGRIVIVEPDIRQFMVKLIALGEKILLMRSHFLSGEEISALFSNLDAKIHVFVDENNILLVAEKARKM
jgi:ubiquinone/menaquinone biosynthesis C-methylase UbiE